MRREHFERLAPLCPQCRAGEAGAAPVRLREVSAERGPLILEGVLECSSESCRMEYPVLDGIPLLVPDLPQFITDNLWAIAQRDDLSAMTEGLIGDGAGHGSAFDAIRQQLSIYGFDHYGDLDPQESSVQPSPGAVTGLLKRGLELLPDAVEGPVVEVGCSVGRNSLVLAERFGGPCLGVDVSISMLRLAQRILRDGVVRYPRRRTGIVFDRREFRPEFPGAERADFWACNAQALPFPDHSIGALVALNLLDCLPAPLAFLHDLPRLLRPGGWALLATPYDWSTSATPVQHWIGGHSQRGADRGACEPLLRSLLTPGAHPQSVPGLEIQGELEDVPWQTRLHDRSYVSYRVHMIALRATG